MIKDAAIKKLFDEYEKAFQKLDIAANASFYADTFISAGPRGAVAQSKAEFLKFANQAADFYRKVGQTDAKLISADETPISDHYSWVKVHWGVKFAKTGDRWIEFDVSYFVHSKQPEPQIIMFISHEDEEEAMRALGVL